MKKILTWLLCLVGTPLVAYATWRLYFMLFAWGVSPWFVIVALIIMLVFALEYTMSKKNWTDEIYQWKITMQREVEKDEHMTPEKKESYLEKIEETATREMNTKIESSVRKENHPYIARCITYVWLFVVVLVSVFALSQLNSAKVYGKVICAPKKIFSTSGEVLATPQEHSKPQLIKRDGSMYILYGDKKKSFSIYDLDGKLVECQDKNDRE